MNTEQQNKEMSEKMGQIIAKCWADEKFKAKLLADPAATLKAEGVGFPEGLAITAVANTDKVLNLVIPAAPDDLSDEDLEAVTGGVIPLFALALGVTAVHTLPFVGLYLMDKEKFKANLPGG